MRDLVVALLSIPLMIILVVMEALKTLFLTPFIFVWAIAYRLMKGY